MKVIPDPIHCTEEQLKLAVKFYRAPTQISPRKVASELRKLTRGDVIDKANVAWPNNNPTNTWLSYTCLNLFRKQATEVYGVRRLRQIENEILKSLDYWRLPKSLQLSDEAKRTIIKVASHADKNVVTYRVNGIVRYKAKCDGVTDFRTIFEDLQKTAHRYPWETRQDVAVQLLKKADELQIKLTKEEREYLQKTANQGLMHRDKVVEYLIERSYVYKNPELKQIAKQAADHISNLKHVNLPKTVRANVLSLIDELNRLDGLKKAASGRFNTPEQDLIIITQDELLGHLKQHPQIADEIVDVPKAALQSKVASDFLKNAGYSSPEELAIQDKVLFEDFIQLVKRHNGKK